ncbi:MAG: NAD-dependent epimerase/dehydratase family protein [Candidatus Omnitrophica bacterium]|nr:NAD-dependent epimerase/dehydratase family protein [Candidatus Omnitrophota bacterium]
MIENSRILITGAGGFIGSHMARELFSGNNFVRGVDIKWDNYIPEACCSEKLTMDLRVKENCLKATEGIDYVFNLAANMGGIGFITEVGADVMYDNTLINAHMIRSSFENKVKRILFSSSACIYPNFKQTSPEVSPLKEEDAYPADPDSFYGWEKLYTEKMLEAFGRDCSLDTRIVRYHNIYGPEGTFKGGREKSPAALCRKIAQAADPGEIEIWGDGRQTRSYCYIDDCVKGTIMLMESDFSQPLNIGSDRLVTIDELADIIIKISGKKIVKHYDTTKPQGVRGRNSDNTMLRKILKWEPGISLEEGLKNTYIWIEKELTNTAKGSVV